MNKFLCVIVFVISFFSLQAQTQDSKDEMQVLVQRVDSLEHELSYLSLSYELQTLVYDMSFLSNALYDKCLTIQLYMYNRNFDYEIYNMYEQYYDAAQIRKQSISELVEVKKVLLTVMIVTRNYSETEKDTLIKLNEVINSTHNTLEVAMDTFKSYIDMYKGYI